ncbi:hypothetical protein NMY22_g13568 [Coprinellus aureogranulatus]|nr:hypothetical protein NMY22_g13568 [Coprinellus aureogranulatus]
MIILGYPAALFTPLLSFPHHIVVGALHPARHSRLLARWPARDGGTRLSRRGAWGPTHVERPATGHLERRQDLQRPSKGIQEPREPSEKSCRLRDVPITQDVLFTPGVSIHRGGDPRAMDANKLLTTLILTTASLHCTDVIDSCHCLWHAIHGDEGAELLFKGLSWMIVKATTDKMAKLGPALRRPKERAIIAGSPRLRRRIEWVLDELVSCTPDIPLQHSHAHCASPTSFLISYPLLSLDWMSIPYDIINQCTPLILLLDRHLGRMYILALGLAVAPRSTDGIAGGGTYGIAIECRLNTLSSRLPPPTIVTSCVVYWLCFRRTWRGAQTKDDRGPSPALPPSLSLPLCSHRFLLFTRLILGEMTKVATPTPEMAQPSPRSSGAGIPLRSPVLSTEDFAGGL